MSKLIINSPEILKEFLSETAKELGVSLNALILQILWDWKNWRR